VASKRVRGPYGLLFVAAALSSICYFAYGPLPPIGGGGEMVALAENLVLKGAYVDPFAIDGTGPTAVVPPLYPLLLAVLYKLFGSWSGLAALLLNYQLIGVHAALLLWLSRRLLGESSPGYCAAGISIVLPVFRPIPGWDTLVTANGLLLFAAVFSRMPAEPRRRLRTAAAAGVAAGLLALLSPSTVAVTVIWVLVALWRARPGRWPAARLLAVFAAAVMLTCSPWLVRNRVSLGAFVMKDNFGMTLYASNNDCAQPSLIENLREGCYQSHHPAGSREEAQLLVRLGEVPYDSFRTSTALHWIRANPGRFLQLTGRRVADFWFPSTEGGIFAYTVWFLTLATGPGLFLMWRRGTGFAAPALAVLAAYPLFYYVVVSDVRYRYPILWLSLLPAGYLLSRLIGGLAGKGLLPKVDRDGE
jgi:hypothetical protein